MFRQSLLVACKLAGSAAIGGGVVRETETEPPCTQGGMPCSGSLQGCIVLTDKSFGRT